MSLLKLIRVYNHPLQFMKIIALFIIISTICFAGNAKYVRKSLKLSNFQKQGPFIFITKLHIGPGYGEVDARYTKGDEIASEQFYNDLSIGIINETTLNQFSKTQICTQKDQLLYRKQKFNMRQERHGIKNVKFFDLQSEDVWYFYIFSCTNNLEQLTNSTQQIKFQITALNNGSHFGQNQLTLYGYVAIMMIWTLLMIHFALPMGTLLSLQNPNTLKLTIFGGLVLLGAGYLYRVIHLVIYNVDGSGIYIFQLIYVIFKNAGEAIITTVIVTVAWGWSIVHLNGSQSYIIIGVLTGIVNIVSLVLSSLTEEHEQLFHHYDTIPGGIVLILRIIIFIVFTVGIISSLRQTGGKTVYFIKRLGILGGIYLLSWPVTVLIVQLTLPNYMHREVITFIEETTHICASTLICHMISNPESAYRKVSLHEDDNPLNMTEYRNK